MGQVREQTREITEESWKVKKLYLEDKLTMREISVIMKSSPRKVRTQLVVDHYIVIKQSTKEELAAERLSAKKCKAEWAKNKYTNTEIAKRLGMSGLKVTHVLKEYYNITHIHRGLKRVQLSKEVCTMCGNPPASRDMEAPHKLNPFTVDGVRHTLCSDCLCPPLPHLETPGFQTNTLLDALMLY